MREIEFRSNAIEPTECLKLGWKIFLSRFWLFLGLVLFLGFQIGFIIQMISPFPAFFTQLISTVISGCVSTGIFYVVLSEIDGKRSDFTMVANVLPSASSIGVVALIGAAPSLILGLIFSRIYDASEIFSASSNNIASLGSKFFLFTALGLFISFMLYFAYPLIAEYRLGAVETLKLSATAATQNFKGLVALCVLNFLIFLGALFVGLLFIMALGAGSTALGAEFSVLIMIPMWVSLSVAVSLSYANAAHAYRQVFPRNDKSVI